MAAARSSATGAVPGGRVLSRSSPSTPSSMNRACQRQTVVLAVPVAAMMPFVPTSSALSSTIRARQTCFWGVLRSATSASSRCRSVSPRVMEMSLRMRQTRIRRCQGESQTGLNRLDQSTSSCNCLKLRQLCDRRNKACSTQIGEILSSYRFLDYSIVAALFVCISKKLQAKCRIYYRETRVDTEPRWHMAHGTWHMAHGTWHMAHGTWRKGTGR